MLPTFVGDVGIRSSTMVAASRIDQQGHIDPEKRNSASQQNDQGTHLELLVVVTDSDRRCLLPPQRRRQSPRMRRDPKLGHGQPQAQGPLKDRPSLRWAHL